MLSPQFGRRGGALDVRRIAPEPRARSGASDDVYAVFEDRGATDRAVLALAAADVPGSTVSILDGARLEGQLYGVRLLEAVAGIDPAGSAIGRLSLLLEAAGDLAAHLLLREAPLGRQIVVVDGGRDVAERAGQVLAEHGARWIETGRRYA
jgi:hypothetical protein